MNIQKLLKKMSQDNPKDQVKVFKSKGELFLTIEYIETVFRIDYFSIKLEKPICDIVLFSKEVSAGDAYEILDSLINDFWDYQIGDCLWYEVEK